VHAFGGEPPGFETSLLIIEIAGRMVALRVLVGRLAAAVLGHPARPSDRQFRRARLRGT
jgi:hypothetical protein